MIQVSMGKLAMPSTISGKRSAKSYPLRVMSLTGLPSFRARMRKPSCLRAVIPRSICYFELASASPGVPRQGMDRLRTYIDALRVLARMNDPNRVDLIKRNIDNYLKMESGAKERALERLRVAIHNEEAERREREDWSVAKEYVRSLPRRMT
jgi:hypothetical protein